MDGLKAPLALLILFGACWALLAISVVRDQGRLADCRAAVRLNDQAEELADQIASLTWSARNGAIDSDEAMLALHAQLVQADQLATQIEIRSAACLGRPVLPARMPAAQQQGSVL